MKKIWVFGHYGAPPSITGALRNYNMAKFLIADGYDVTVFASSAIHNQARNMIEGTEPYVQMDGDGVPFVYIKTRNYTGNGMQRILNILDYYRGLKKNYKRFPKPDLIYAACPTPLACVAGWKIAKKLKVPYICEVVDLWPESIVDYLGKSKQNPIIRMLYHMEKKMYQKAAAIVFSMEGGKDYLIDQGWDKQINMSKVYDVNMGIDLNEFDRNLEKCKLEDDILENKDLFKVAYCGSIRLMNDVKLIVDTARLLKESHPNIHFLIYGDGDSRQELEEFCVKNKIDNITFRGRISKQKLPYLLTHSDVNVLTYKQVGVWKYGGSQSKLFDYLASGRPILSSLKMGYSLIERYECGLVTEEQTPEMMAEALLQLYRMPQEELVKMGQHARKAAEDYNLPILIKKWERILEDVESTVGDKSWES